MGSAHVTHTCLIPDSSSTYCQGQNDAEGHATALQDWFTISEAEYAVHSYSSSFSASSIMRGCSRSMRKFWNFELDENADSSNGKGNDAGLHAQHDCRVVTCEREF